MLYLDLMVTANQKSMIDTHTHTHPHTHPPTLGGSEGKEPVCNVGDLPGLGRSPWEGNGYSVQYGGASLVIQMVKNLPAIWETWV